MKVLYKRFLIVAVFFFCLTMTTLAVATEPVTSDTDPSGTGIIDRVDFEKAEIVIGDYLYAISDGTKYFSASRMRINKNRFVDGMTIQYLVDEDQNLLALWEVLEEDKIVQANDMLTPEEEQVREITPSSGSDGGGGGPLKLVNGVWTN